MSSLPPFDRVARKTFSFFPPILNIEHNEWEYRRATWSEVLVANCRSGVEIWIPRRYVGEASSIDEPMAILGLTKELEYKAGTVWPHERRILEMPRAATAMPVEMPGPAAGSPPAHGSKNTTESRIGRLIAGALAAGILACFLVVAVFRSGPTRTVHFSAGDEDFLSLSRRDDYFSVVRKLGPPTEDRWRSQSGELQYRLLWYPRRSYYVILLGSDRRDTHYIGALDDKWRVLHFIDLPTGGTTAAMLRELPKF